MVEIYFFNNKTRRFYDSLDDFLSVHVKESFEVLEDKTNNLGLPLSRSLGGGLFELRIIDIVHIRFIYCFHQDHIWMLHGFIKKTDRISNSDMRYAKDEFKRLLRDYNR